MDSEAKEALILRLFRAFPGGEKAISRAVLDGYLEVLDAYSVQALQRAVERFRHGLVERDNHAFVPKVPEVAIEVRRQESLMHVDHGPKVVPYLRGESPPEGMVPLGPTRVDFGHGAIDMREMSHAEKEAVLNNKGLPAPDGQKVIPQMRRMR